MFATGHYIPGKQKLVGKCRCGSTGWTAEGSSSINFICHCSICRSASKRDFLAAAGFKRSQVFFNNEECIERTLPEGSRNHRLFCKECGDYLAEDASPTMGVTCLPLHQAVSPCPATHTTPGSTDSTRFTAPSAETKATRNADADKYGLPNSVAKEYRPNMHIFYGSRVLDVSDSLPKWTHHVQGNISCKAAECHTDVAELQDSPQEGIWFEESTGRLHKDVAHLSPLRPPYPDTYTFTETDPEVNHVTAIPHTKLHDRVQRKYERNKEQTTVSGKKRDVIIIGGGHNGLISAAYLAKKGLDVLVLERRHCVGGAAVTEEIVPGFKFSRASYLAGLLRPKVIEELELEQYGFKYIERDPSSFTPTRVDGINAGKYLMLGSDEAANRASISQFSERDAAAFGEYEAFLDSCRELVQPLLDAPLPNVFYGTLKERVSSLKTMAQLGTAAFKNKHNLVPFYELLTGPASQILDRWFESDVVKATLATDAVIGALCSPYQQGSAYVLLHHVMGEAAGKKGVWAYVQGGMGAVSEAVAASARARGAEIVTGATVDRIDYSLSSPSSSEVCGVTLADGTHVPARTVLSNAGPYHTFLELLPGLAQEHSSTSPIPQTFRDRVRFADYSCGAFKINCAIDRLPNFLCCPTEDQEGKVAGPQHRGTIHFEETMEDIDTAWREASMGIPAARPVVEMTIPSSLDPSVAPKGKHVAQLFVQFAPYDVDKKLGNWADPAFKQDFVSRVFSIIDEHAPNFSDSVIQYDALSPLDLERIFGLHKGNIFHGAMGIHQLAYARPAPGYSNHRTPVKGLYLCGSGAHPGGGVMGSSGRNCAHVVLADLK